VGPLSNRTWEIIEVNIPRSGGYTFTRIDRVGIRSKKLSKGLGFLGSQGTPYGVYYRY
jgi:hypothetical protein